MRTLGTRAREDTGPLPARATPSDFRYGKLTVVLSPLAEMVKVPAAVEL